MDTVTEAASGRVRTFNARRGRMSALTRERLDRLMPRHGIPGGLLVPHEAFGRTAPLVLEIGSGHGAAALAYAVAHPDHDVLAVDVHPPGLARMLAAAERAGVENLWAHQGDAVVLLEEQVPGDSLRAVHLFFPDPWLKARHARRRFVGRDTLDLLAERIVAGGELLVATDQDAYAAHAARELGLHPRFEVTEVARPDWRPVDGYEAKGLAAGRRVTDLRATVCR